MSSDLQLRPALIVLGEYDYDSRYLLMLEERSQRPLEHGPPRER